MDPTTVTVSNQFCFVSRVPFSSPSIFLFFSFLLPVRPFLSPKAETQTQKNVSTSVASSVPSSLENNAQVFDVYSSTISAVVTHFPTAPTRKPKPIKISQAFSPRQDHHHSPVNNIELSDVYGGAISSVMTYFPATLTSNNTNVTHFPILSRTISSDPRRCFPPSLSSAQPIICLLPLLMSPLLVAICAIWIGVWKGPPYLSVISVGGSMDVSSGCRTPIRHVSSSNGWTRTHAHVAVQQHHLSMKGLPDIRPRS